MSASEPMEAARASERGALLAPAGTAVSLAGVACAAALVLAERRMAAGAVLAPAAVIGGFAARATGYGATAWRSFLVSAAGRMAEGAALASVAWTERLEDPRTAAAAVTALGLAFVAAYARVRARSLGLLQAPATSPEHFAWLAVLAAGLLAGTPEAALWVVAALATGALVRDSRRAWRREAAG